MKNQNRFWGLLTSIDLYECNIDKIANPNVIRKYVDELCQLIKMRKYGELLLEKFGKGELEGYSFVQLIETSSISGHFDNHSQRAFIDIFSCEMYKPKKAAEFTKNFFDASSYKIRIIPRK